MDLQPTTDSISAWIGRLKAGEADAARRLWDRYAQRLIELARRKLPPAARPAVQEDDIALSVFESLCRGADAGRFQDLRNRDELWWYLLAATDRKVVDYVRHQTAQKRGGGRAILSENAAQVNFQQIVSREPTPEYLVMLDEERRRLLGLLRDEQLRRVAVWRIEGYTVEEIADKLAIAPRSVKRKLALIRSTWKDEVHA